MKLKCIFILAVAAIFFTVPKAALGGLKPVMVHYMPWFQSPYSLGTGNWGYHWKLGNNFNPNTINPTNNERQIASWYYPQIGPYDSLNPAVLEYHVLLMKLGGIDGVIVDWYGQDNYYDYGINNQRTLTLFNYTRKAGLKFSLCYEDATLSAEISGGNMNGVNVSAANAIAHAQQTLLYAQTNFFNDPSFLRLNNAPVFLNFGPQYFKNSSDWTSIFSVLATSNQPAFFTEDNRLAAGQGAFDWPPMALSGGGILSSNQLQTYLVNFEQTAKSQAWPNFVSSAFPRFHDFYAQAGAGSSYGYLDDGNGSTLTSTLTRALTNNSALVQLVTWNDYGEGTIIEPTLAGNEPATQYGYTDLGIIQNLRRQYLEASFPYHTNDLALALRLYNLRTQYASNQPIAAELDRIFTNIIAGKLVAASLQLTGIESNHPVIYNLSTGSNQLQFVIGGYLASGARVEMSTDLLNWQTAQTFSAGTNLVMFSTDTTHPVCRFFKVQ
ncbi:MAG TPA: glycoside hydrolase family 71/99-like protein [Verrucomicrobiae bacterium]